MQNRIVEIASDGAYISVARGFVRIALNGELAGQVAIDDMAGLVIRGHGATLSANICTRLAEANIPVVICSGSQAPAAVIWPVSGHHAQGLRMQAQAVASKPRLKQLWSQIVKAKIMAQVQVLEAVGGNFEDLIAMASRIRSGDPENLEAQAARRYWPRLMGEDFRRDQAAEGANAALNYGYTVLRSAAARSILSAGLHPSLSINHQSQGDALRLADDLMEPFRPWVDRIVHHAVSAGEKTTTLVIDSDLKARLVGVLSLDLEGRMGASPLQLCLDRLAYSLVRVFLKEEKRLEFPTGPVWNTGAPS